MKTSIDLSTPRSYDFPCDAVFWLDFIYACKSIQIFANYKVDIFANIYVVVVLLLLEKEVVERNKGKRRRCSKLEKKAGRVKGRDESDVWGRRGERSLSPARFAHHFCLYYFLLLSLSGPPLHSKQKTNRLELFWPVNGQSRCDTGRRLGHAIRARAIRDVAKPVSTSSRPWLCWWWVTEVWN